MASIENTANSIIQVARSAPYLKREEEHVLAVKWADQQDRQALHKLTLAHMRLGIAMAARFRGYGLPMADLVQESHVGILLAAARFDPRRGVRFSTYASWWIRASIQDFILRNWSIVRGGTSSGQKSLFFGLRRLQAKILRSGKISNRHQLYHELAEAIGVSVKDVATMDARLSGPDISLNTPVIGEEGNSCQRQDILVSPASTPDILASAIIDSERCHAWLQRALKVLNERELKIVKRRQFCDTTSTLQQLGGELGISKERVRQLESRALEKLRLELTRDFPGIKQLI